MTKCNATAESPAVRARREPRVRRGRQRAAGNSAQSRTRSASSRTASTRRGRSSTCAARDVFVIHSLYGEPAQSANDKLVRLLFFIGALKDAAAGRVTAVVPYLAYARKDRKTKARDPVTTRYVACLFEAVGTDCVVTLDVHNLAAFQNAFRCRTENLEANSLFVAHFAPLVRDAEVAVVSPDAGGIKRAEQFRNRLADALQRPVGAAFAEKYRSAGVVSGEALVGDVGGKVAIIIDDLISAGTTIARAAQACRDHGATRVLAAASHGLFAGAANAVLAPAPSSRSSSPTACRRCA